MERFTADPRRSGSGEDHSGRWCGGRWWTGSWRGYTVGGGHGHGSPRKLPISLNLGFAAGSQLQDDHGKQHQAQIQDTITDHRSKTKVAEGDGGDGGGEVQGDGSTSEGSQGNRGVEQGEGDGKDGGLDRGGGKRRDESEILPKCPPAIQPKRRDRIECILDDQAITIKNKGYQHYLVQWQGRPESEDSWITREDLQQIDPDLLERYQSQISPYSIGSSSSHPRRIGADTKVRKRLRSNSSK